VVLLNVTVALHEALIQDDAKASWHTHKSGVVTVELETVTATLVVDLFPAASLAMAEIVYVPFVCEVVFHE
jgi:hypothetical protein